MQVLKVLLCLLIIFSLCIGCTTHTSDDKTIPSTTLPDVLHANWYYYNQLNDDEKAIYCEILRQVQNNEVLIQFYEQELIGKYLSQESMWKVEAAFSQDHPEYFWTTRYLAINRENNLTTIDYRVADAVAEIYEQLQKTADNIINTIPKQATEYEKVQHFYMWILDNVKYQSSLQYDQDIRGSLLYGKGVCNSYAYTFKFLCDKAKIPCIVVYGTAKGTRIQNHTWNAVQLDDKWYWVDATWGDTTNDAHKYLCTNDEILMQTHKIWEFACDIQLSSSLRFVFPSCPDIYHNNTIA